jgi:hypothetical protein
MLNNIRELIHPKPSASFNHPHSIHFAAAGMNEARTPMERQTIMSHESLKIRAMASKPVTITKMVL